MCSRCALGHNGARTMEIVVSFGLPKLDASSKAY